MATILDYHARFRVAIGKGGALGSILGNFLEVEGSVAFGTDTANQIVELWEKILGACGHAEPAEIAAGETLPPPCALIRSLIVWLIRFS